MAASPKRGRPAAVMTPDVCAAIADLVAHGMTHHHAAITVGVNPAAARRHKARNPEYAELLKQAERRLEQRLLGLVQCVPDASGDEYAILVRFSPGRAKRLGKRVHALLVDAQECRP